MSISRERPTGWGEGPFDKEPQELKVDGILGAIKVWKKDVDDMIQGADKASVKVDVVEPEHSAWKMLPPVKVDIPRISTPEVAAAMFGVGSGVHEWMLEHCKTPEQRAKEKAESEAYWAQQKQVRLANEAGLIAGKQLAVNAILDMMRDLTDKHELMLLTEVLVAVKEAKAVCDE